MRDLCRTRGDMVEDLTRARNRLTKFLLRHSRVWRGGSNWTVKHEAWLAAQRFDERALQTTFEHYRAVVLCRDAQLAAVEADLKSWIGPGPVRRAGPPSRRLPWRDGHGGIELAGRGVRLAPLRAAGVR